LELKFHPVADIFPLMQGEEFDDFVESIRTNGLLNPIRLHPDDGSIVDGRNRERGCAKAGVEPRYETWNGKGSLVAFVVAQNRDRRHLSATDKALLGKKLLPLLAEEAKKRQREHGKTAPGKKSLTQKVGEVKKHEGEAVAEAAKLAGTNRQYVSDLVKMEREAPTVYAKIEKREIEMPVATKLLGHSPEFQSRAIAMIQRGEAKSVVDASRLIKHQDMADAGPLPAGRYRILYCDPPWKYGNANLQKYGHASFHYPQMSIDELCELAIANLAIDDAVLFLWVPTPLLEDAFKVINSWDFAYKTSLVWDKVKHNWGNYVSVRHEHLLIATRGSCVKDNPKCDVRSVQTIERTEHSAKPEQFRAIIDHLYFPPKKGRNDRIELFPRWDTPPKNWDGWGNEVSN
jgi:N6-adenosine-specific RNA methylase IME4